ncbi:uncharacterized protein KY384_000142 [Bacidia gigantensis]|uniref:uncharacterized protein n=1 Tax=Bacidia gigantensis TaxID=2732470 RepID=UPI001D041657|nr:uncharacterized protein KY384_000142 [Bacidia gigantensis]KAG8526149.1 hypothetical protein KY384_000142 [Bacidia gigantensis]
MRGSTSHAHTSIKQCNHWDNKLNYRRAGSGTVTDGSKGLNGSDTSFDYIIVGGGNAGLTLAARLSENSLFRVAVIEAGGFYEDSVGSGSQLSVPANAILWAGKDPKDTNPNVDWGFTTVPQAGAHNEIIHYARGKTLGGCTARNYMAYQRGTISSYQAWAEEVGDPSYTFENLLPYFEKSLNFTPPKNEKRGLNATPDYDDTFLGAGGNPLTSHSLATPFHSHRGSSKPTKGFTSGSLLGSAYNVATINSTTGLRESSETAFLQPTKGRSNLVVYTHTLAKKVVFEGKTAVGIQVAGGNQTSDTITLSAKKEVILSAGVFQSPQLLMVSGVGPKAILDQFDIPIIADRPGVGQNMWDHVLFGPSYSVNLITDSSLGQTSYLDAAMKEFAATQSGILSNPGSDFLAWEKLPPSSRSSLPASALSDLSQFPDDWPELEYLAIGAYFGLQENFVTGAPHDTNQYVTLAAALVAPLSRGNVSISSPDTADQPLINPNWLTHPTDQAVAIAAYKRARAAFATPVMQEIVIGDEAFPGKTVGGGGVPGVGGESDEEILETVRRSFGAVFHASATNKMGKESDKMAVVDSRCRVMGVRGLRVVDASAFPFLPPGHPMATIYALAEKIADDIKTAVRYGGNQ